MTGERDKTRSLLLGTPLGKRKESGVWAPTHCAPLRETVPCLCSPPGVMAAHTVNHVFHSVLSLPISQQGHIPPSFSPLTVKPYHQAECFKVSGNSIHSGSVNSWDTLSLKIKLVNVQHKLLFFKQCKMLYLENGSLSQKVTDHTLVQSAKRNVFKGWSDRFANIFLLHLLKHTRGFSVKTMIFTRSKDQGWLMFIQWTQGSKRI